MPVTLPGDVTGTGTTTKEVTTMDDKGKLTTWTAILTVASIALAIAGGWMAPDSVATWLLVAAWLCSNTALNNVYGKVRAAVREREIREEERQRLGGLPRQDRR